MKPTSEKIYQVLTADDEDVRACKGIKDDACQQVPGNFLRLLIALLLSKLADALISAKVVLPWLMATVGAPVFFSSLLVPIRESGSLIPQLLLGGVIRRYARRKWFYVVGSVLQAMTVFGMALAALSLSGFLAGLSIILLLLFFSLARGMCSVASKDVLGKTVPKQRRGRLNGYSASVAGLVALGVGAALYWSWYSQGSLISLLLAGAICWLLSGAIASQINEYAGATEGGANAFKSAWASLSLLKQDPNFRHFVLVRSLMMTSALLAPYLVVLAKPEGEQLEALGLFLLVAGLASFISGPFWGKLADISSRRLLIMTSAATALISLITFILVLLGGSLGLYWGLCLFFLLSVIHEGVRLGRKTYIVDMAEGNRRNEYVSVSNTLIGVLLLFIGLVAAAIAQISLGALMLTFTLAAGFAAWLSFGMKELVDHD